MILVWKDYFFPSGNANRMLKRQNLKRAWILTFSMFLIGSMFFLQSGSVYYAGAFIGACFLIFYLIWIELKKRRTKIKNKSH
jgi:membrane associated rhomboid family serine protease